MPLTFEKDLSGYLEAYFTECLRIDGAFGV